MTGRNAELNGEFNRIRLKIQIEAKIAEKKNKKNIWKRKLIKNFFWISTKKKFHWNDKCQCRVQLKIQIEMKMREKKTITFFLKNINEFDVVI